MTPRTLREERRTEEIERGRQVAERARRRDFIDRAVKGKLLVVKLAPDVAPAGNSRFTLDDEFWVGGVCIGTEDVDSQHFPSDALMAKLVLAITFGEASAGGLDALPAPVPTHKIGPEAKAYNAALAERNKNRPDFQ